MKTMANQKQRCAEVFAVFQQGVYRHECGGIFETKDAAVEHALRLAAMDGDSYHEYEVFPFKLNEQRHFSSGEGRFRWLCDPAAIFKARKKVAE